MVAPTQAYRLALITTIHTTIINLENLLSTDLRPLHIASKLPSYELSGEVEADESYFGGMRKGKR